MAPAHKGGRVQDYIAMRAAEGRLVYEDIDGGLTSVLQVCDLAANKEVKDLIKRGYLMYRTEFIRDERAKTPNDPDRRVKMKVPIVKMMEIIEDAVKKFNKRQRETESIKRTFISAGQHPWKDCKEEFKRHLDGLSTLPLYGGCKTSSHVIEDRNLKSRTGLSLPDMGLEVDREETVVEAPI